MLPSTCLGWFLSAWIPTMEGFYHFPQIPPPWLRYSPEVCHITGSPRSPYRSLRHGQLFYRILSSALGPLHHSGVLGVLPPCPEKTRDDLAPFPASALSCKAETSRFPRL